MLISVNWLAKYAQFNRFESSFQYLSFWNEPISRCGFNQLLDKMSISIFVETFLNTGGRLFAPQDPHQGIDPRPTVASAAPAHWSSVNILVSWILAWSLLDQQEASTITPRYFTALCLPMGKTWEIFDLHFLAKPGFFQANCDVTKVEVPNCVPTCNMRNEFTAVRVYKAVKNPATTDRARYWLQLHAGINSVHASGGDAFKTH